MLISNRNIFLLIILLLLIVLVPAISGLVGLMVDTELSDGDDYDTLVENFIVSMARINAQVMLSGLMLGMSIFNLFVVYQGGRSNRRLFNDRTLDAMNLFRGIFSETALCRAVFIFLFFDSHPQMNNAELSSFPNPILYIMEAKHDVSYCWIKS